MHSKERSVAAGGRPQTDYPVIDTVWASAETVTRELTDFADRPEMPVLLPVITHFSERYLAARRISWRGRLFRVTAINEPDLMRRDLEFTVEEIFR